MLLTCELRPIVSGDIDSVEHTHVDSKPSTVRTNFSVAIPAFEIWPTDFGLKLSKRQSLTHDDIKPVQLLVHPFREVLDALHLAQIQLPHLGNSALALIRFDNLLRGFFSKTDVADSENQMGRVVLGKGLCSFEAESAEIVFVRRVMGKREAGNSHVGACHDHHAA